MALGNDSLPKRVTDSPQLPRSPHLGLRPPCGCLAWPEFLNFNCLVRPFGYLRHSVASGKLGRAQPQKITLALGKSLPKRDFQIGDELPSTKYEVRDKVKLAH